MHLYFPLKTTKCYVLIYCVYSLNVDAVIHFFTFHEYRYVFTIFLYFCVVCLLLLVCYGPLLWLFH